MTYRFHGHYEGDPQRYRTLEEVSDRRLRDPIVATRGALMAAGVNSHDLDNIEVAVDSELVAAIEQARAAPPSTFEDARRAVTAPRKKIVEGPVSGSEDYRIMDAVHDALADAMAEDPTVWVAGIDVAAGNVFGLMRGLSDQFGDRVRDTPISESAIVGAAVGGALAGTRPVVELMYLDFIGVCFDQLLNQAAKIRFMTGGKIDLPLVVRTQFGAGRSSAAQHSQSLEAVLAHIPGLTVVMPSSPADTYGLLRAAIEDPNPVVFIEHRLLYGLKGPRPDSDHRVPMGTGVVRRRGSDLTIVSWSSMALKAMDAADLLAQEGVDAEVIDMRCVAPLDLELVSDSVRRTGRLVVAHEAVLSGGVGAEIVAHIADACFWDLDAPLRRVGAESMPAPYAPALEAMWLPDTQRIVDAALAVSRA